VQCSAMDPFLYFFLAKSSLGYEPVAQRNFTAGSFKLAMRGLELEPVALKICISGPFNLSLQSPASGYRAERQKIGSYKFSGEKPEVPRLGLANGDRWAEEWVCEWFDRGHFGGGP
jgi:hypothetical protein